MARVPFLMKPKFRAHVIVFASRRDGKWLGWGIYSEYPLAQKHDGTQTEQKLLFVVDAESYERAEKTAEFIVGNDVRLPGNNPRFFALSQILRKTVLQEASHDTPSGKSFAQAAMGILIGMAMYAGIFLLPPYSLGFLSGLSLGFLGYLVVFVLCASAFGVFR